MVCLVFHCWYHAVVTLSSRVSLLVINFFGQFLLHLRANLLHLWSIIYGQCDKQRKFDESQNGDASEKIVPFQT